MIMTALNVLTRTASKTPYFTLPTAWYYSLLRKSNLPALLEKDGDDSDLEVVKGKT